MPDASQQKKEKAAKALKAAGATAKPTTMPIEKIKCMKLSNKKVSATQDEASHLQ